jgi:hypothetical protein
LFREIECLADVRHSSGKTGSAETIEVPLQQVQQHAQVAARKDIKL